MTKSIENLRARDAIKIKKRQKHTKQDSSDSFPSNSDFYDKSDYRHKKRKNKRSHRKKDPIKLCARLTAKFLTTAYKSKTIKFKLDEDPLQRRIYFLTFAESMETIFYQYKETREVLIDYPKTGGENIKYFVKKSIRNILHANIDVHIRKLISDLPGDGVILIAKI